MRVPKVLNKRRDTIPKDAVYCGRPSKWGNPFQMRCEEERDFVCDQFEMHVLPTLDVSELKGKDLVCWCAPLRCHCDSLVAKANGLTMEEYYERREDVLGEQQPGTFQS